MDLCACLCQYPVIRADIARYVQQCKLSVCCQCLYRVNQLSSGLEKVKICSAKYVSKVCMCVSVWPKLYSVIGFVNVCVHCLVVQVTPLCQANFCNEPVCVCVSLYRLPVRLCKTCPRLGRIFASSWPVLYLLLTVGCLMYMYKDKAMP